MTKKTVTAPRAYDPGKGRPREHLAYLNEREMAYLRSINGDNMERGPKGLPSFPPNDAIGSSSKASSSRGPGGPSGPNSGPSGSRGLGGGNKSGVGGGGGGGGGATGSRGSSTGSVGSRSGSQAPGNRGVGGQGGVASGARMSPSASPKVGGYKGPSSPMAGQGQSFRSPMGAGWHNRDTIQRQKVQINSVRDAIRSTPAARNDLAVGGIRALNVGPMGTPVKVGGPTAIGTKQFYDRVPQAAIPSRVPPANVGALKDQYGYYKNPNAPMAPMVGDKLGEYLKAQEKFERDMRSLGQGVYRPDSVVTPTGNPNIVGGPPRGKTRGIGDSLSAPKTEMSVDDIVNSLTPKPGSVAVPRSDVLPDVSVPDRVDLSDVYGPSLPKERIISVEDFPDTSIKQKIANESVYTMGLHGYPKEQMLRPGMHSDTNTPNKISKALAEAEDYRDMVSSLSRQTQKVSGVGDIYDPSGEFDQATKIPSWSQSTYTGQRPSVADAAPPESYDETIVDSPYISPTTQMPPEGLPETPTGVGVFEKTLPGKLGKGMKWAIGKEYESLSPQERADLMERWAKQNQAYLRGGAMPSGVKSQIAGGGAPDIGSGGKFQYRPGSGGVPYVPPPTPTEKAEKGRPQLYYNWDAGVGIPSPGDSDYTLYLKYLEEKAAARAAVS